MGRFGPELAVRWIGDGWPSKHDVRAIFVASTNSVAIDHYFVDGAVWKLSDRNARRELFRHLGKS